MDTFLVLFITGVVLVVVIYAIWASAGVWGRGRHERGRRARTSDGGEYYVGDVSRGNGGDGGDGDGGGAGGDSNGGGGDGGGGGD